MKLFDTSNRLKKTNIMRYNLEEFGSICLACFVRVAVVLVFMFAGVHHLVMISLAPRIEQRNMYTYKK